MPIVTICPHCGQNYSVQNDAVGEKTLCMKCGGVFVITGTMPEDVGRPPKMIPIGDNIPQNTPDATSVEQQEEEIIETLERKRQIAVICVWVSVIIGVIFWIFIIFG